MKEENGIYEDPELDLAWLACGIEGEGSVAIERTAFGPGIVRISVSNNDWTFIRPFLGLGGGTCESTKGTFQWYINGKEAIELAEDLLPYIRSERKRKLVNLVSQYPAGKVGHDMSPAQRKIRQEIFNEVKKINDWIY